MHPGDNYRIVATLKPISSGNFTAIQNDGASAGINDNTGPTPVRLPAAGPAPSLMSGMLTVWRRLHVELDSMGPVTGKAVQGTITGVTMNGTAQSIVTTDQTTHDSLNRFENGFLTDGTGSTYSVISSDIGTNFTVIVKVPSGIAPPLKGSRFSLIDDDPYLNGSKMHLPNTSALATALGQAYVAPVYDNKTTDINVPFVLNVEDGSMVSVVSPNWQSRSLNSQRYWVAYLLGAHQGGQNQDCDPDSEDTLLGLTSRTMGGSIIYEETINEAAAILGGTMTAARVEQVTVVHEIGHDVARGTAEPVTLSDSTFATPVLYTPVYIDAIRKSVDPYS